MRRPSLTDLRNTAGPMFESYNIYTPAERIELLKLGAELEIAETLAEIARRLGSLDDKL